MGKRQSWARKLVCYLFINYALLAIARTEPVEEAESNGYAGGKIIYDQRQSGKYNIHVSIKDVAIIEMDQNEIQDESFGDEDYYYDESDLTVKPIKYTTTTTTTTKTTSTPVTTAAAAAASITLPATTMPSIKANDTENSTQTVGPQKPSNLVILSSEPPSTPKFPGSTFTPQSGHAHHLPAPPTPTGTSRAAHTYTAAHSDDSRIYKLKVRRTLRADNNRQPGSARRCHANQYRDANGNCRNKRSPSILRKLFGMIVSLPFASERHNDAE